MVEKEQVIVPYGWKKPQVLKSNKLYIMVEK